MNSVLVGWKLYYADGSVIDSTKMKFDNAPQGGAEVLVKWHKNESKYSVDIQSGLDFYSINSDIKNVKHGLNIRKERFEEMLEVAKNDKVPITSMVN